MLSLELIRRTLDLDQSQFANLVAGDGVDGSSISRFEAGNIPSGKVVRNVAHYLGKTITDAFKFLTSDLLPEEVNAWTEFLKARCVGGRTSNGHDTQAVSHVGGVATAQVEAVATGARKEVAARRVATNAVKPRKRSRVR